MPKKDVFVSVLAVYQDQAGVLPLFLAEAFAMLDANYTNFEIVLLDNGSEDSTPSDVKPLLNLYKCVRYLRLTRPLVEEVALTAGLDTAIGDFVVTIHPDFDPVSDIPAMVDLCRAGNDVVLGRDRSPPRIGPVYRLARWGFRKMSRRFVKFDAESGLTSFRCLSRSAVNAVTRVRSRRRYLTVMLAEVGLVPVFHSYTRISRSGGSPRPRLIRAVRIGLSLLVHHSVAPLRFVSVLGLLGSMASLLYSLYVIGVYLFKQDVMQGWTTLSLQVSGLFVLVFLMLTLIGEYVNRMLDELIDRPLYHIREERASAVMITDVSRRNVIDESTGIDTKG